MRKQVDHVNQKVEPTAVPSSGELLELMHQLMHQVRAEHLRQIAGQEGGLTPLEAKVLGFFHRRPGATPSDLATHVGRDKGQLTRLISGLRDKGLLDALPDEQDRRSIRLHPSASAASLHRQAQRQRLALAERAMAGLSDAQRQTMLGCLQQMQANLGGSED